MQQMRKYFTIFILIFLCFAFSGCTENHKKKDAPWGFSFDQYNYSYNLGADDVIVEKADDICNGKMWVDPNFGEEVLSYDYTSMDWNVNFSSSPNTYQLYLQALNPILYLSRAYLITEKEEYLDYARLLLESWIQYKDSSDSKENIYVWYDHGTALRTDNLIFFLLAYTEAGKLDASFYKQMTALLQEHGAHLSNEKEYFENHNHGIFQDQALIYLAYFLNDDKKEEWLELAQERVQEQENYAFTEEKVHVENSPGYQVGVVDLFYTIAEFLQNMDNDFGSLLYADAIESLEFMAWVTKPNGVLAEIGDTNGVADSGIVNNSSSLKYGNQHYIYSQLRGQSGEKPETHSAIYPQTGYYFGRTSWDEADFEQSTWTMFKAGYSSKTHKHADDISWMLYAKGYDIFVDTGWYNYMSGSKERDYFVSSGAHNTITVDGKSYSPTVENSSKTGFFEYGMNLPYDYVLGYNNMYHGVEIDRHFYYLDNVLILYDDMVSREKHEYSQLFHMSEYMNIEYSSDNEVLLSIADTGYKVRIRQFLPDVMLDVINGDTEGADYGYISRYMNHLDTINTLKFDKQGKDTSYVTIITIEDSHGNVSLDSLGETVHCGDITFDKMKQEVTIPTAEPIHISLQSRQRPDFDTLSVTCDKNQLIVNSESETTAGENEQAVWNYAYYLINYDTGEIDKMDYAPQAETIITVQKSGVYWLKAYMKSATGSQRESRIIGAYKYDNGQFTDVSDEYHYLNLEYEGHHMEKTADNTYRFYVDYSYSWNSTIAFYIYKDGAGYDYVSKENENYFEYTFQEPGKYTIMYYLRTSNGDNEFWNFEQIEIS